MEMDGSLFHSFGWEVERVSAVWRRDGKLTFLLDQWFGRQDHQNTFNRALQLAKSSPFRDSLLTTIISLSFGFSLWNLRLPLWRCLNHGLATSLKALTTS